MNKVMILAILVAYKAFNDKSLTIVVNEGDGDLLNAVKGTKIKVSVTMNTGITYRCYVVDYINTNCFLVTRKYKDEKYDTIDVKYVGRVVIKASH